MQCRHGNIGAHVLNYFATLAIYLPTHLPPPESNHFKPSTLTFAYGKKVQEMEKIECIIYLLTVLSNCYSSSEQIPNNLPRIFCLKAI